MMKDKTEYKYDVCASAKSSQQTNKYYVYNKLHIQNNAKFLTETMFISR